MANSYITADPCSLEEFFEAAQEEGFVINQADHSIIHQDERGCCGISEEEHTDRHGSVATFVGCMGNPDIADIRMVAEDDPEGREITWDQRDDDGEDEEE